MDAESKRIEALRIALALTPGHDEEELPEACDHCCLSPEDWSFVIRQSIPAATLKVWIREALREHDAQAILEARMGNAIVNALPNNDAAVAIQKACPYCLPGLKAEAAGGLASSAVVIGPADIPPSRFALWIGRALGSARAETVNERVPVDIDGERGWLRISSRPAPDEHPSPSPSHPNEIVVVLSLPVMLASRMAGLKLYGVVLAELDDQEEKRWVWCMPPRVVEFRVPFLEPGEERMVHLEAVLGWSSLSAPGGDEGALRRIASSMRVYQTGMGDAGFAHNVRS